MPDSLEFDLTPHELIPYLSRLVEQRLQLSLMLWGPPGIGKPTIVADVANHHGLRLLDLRLSQLAPADLGANQALLSPLQPKMYKLWSDLDQ